MKYSWSDSLVMRTASAAVILFFVTVASWQCAPRGSATHAATSGHKHRDFATAIMAHLSDESNQEPLGVATQFANQFSLPSLPEQLEG